MVLEARRSQLDSLERDPERDPDLSRSMRSFFELSLLPATAVSKLLAVVIPSKVLITLLTESLSSSS